MSRDINSRPPRTITRSTIIESAGKAEVDQESLKDRLMEVLRRESLNLLQESSEGVLGRDRSTALIGYLKFLNNLEESQAERLSELSDEELEKKSKE